MLQTVGTDYAASDPPVRKRRSSQQLRNAVLDAARHLFSSRGYAGTGIREVALEAGATESAVYRHFGSKRGLFEAAVAEPYESFFTEFVERWRLGSTPNSVSTQDAIESFISDLYDLFVEHKALILALIAFQAFESEASNLSRSRQPGFNDQLVPVEKWVLREQEERGLVNVDLPVTLRLAVGMTMSVVLHDGMLFGSRVPSKERVVREITSLIRRGVETRRS